MKKITVEVTYYVEVETDLADSDAIDDFVADYLASSNIEEISDYCTFKIEDYGDCGD